MIIFAYLAKKFGRVTKTDFYRSRRDLRRRKIDWNLFFSISSWHWADNFQDYGKKNRKCPQKCFLRVQRTILAKIDFRKKYYQHFHCFSKKVSASCGKLLTGLWNLPSKRPDEDSEGTKLAWYRWFKSFFDFGRESFKVLPESSQESCQNSILRIQRMNSRRKIVWKYTFLWFLGLRAKVFGLHARSFLQDYHLCILRPKGIFLENFRLRICASHSRISCDKRCEFFCQKLFCRVVPSESKVSR